MTQNEAAARGGLRARYDPDLKLGFRDPTHELLGTLSALGPPFGELSARAESRPPDDCKTGGGS